MCGNSDSVCAWVCVIYREDVVIGGHTHCSGIRDSGNRGNHGNRVWEVVEVMGNGGKSWGIVETRTGSRGRRGKTWENVGNRENR